MKSVLVCLLLLSPLTCRGENRLFVLQGEEAILEVDIDDEGNARQVRTYRERDLPGVFPAQSLEMRDGNILVAYDGQKRQTARLLYRRSQGLTKYGGNPGQASDLAGRRLEKTDTAQNFRSGSRLYSESGGGHYRDRQRLARLQEAAGSRYGDIFVLDDAAFGVAADRIDLLSGDDAGTLDAKEALAMPGSRMTAATVSPLGRGLRLRRVPTHDSPASTPRRRAGRQRDIDPSRPQGSPRAGVHPGRRTAGGQLGTRTRRGAPLRIRDGRLQLEGDAKGRNRPGREGRVRSGPGPDRGLRPFGEADPSDQVES